MPFSGASGDGTPQCLTSTTKSASSATSTTTSSVSAPQGAARAASMGPAGCWATHKRLESWARAARERALGVAHGTRHRTATTSTSSTTSTTDSTSSNSTNSSSEEFNVAKEQHVIQPPQNVSAQTLTAELMKMPLDLCSSPQGSHSLQHQSKSYPGGQPLLCRTPSVSSQSSLDSSASRQGHRGSSPQIRTYGPDGKTSVQPHHEAVHTSSYPLRTTTSSSSRSPSPLRAASLDIRCSSPAGTSNLSGEDLRTPSPSQSSLASLTGCSAASSCNSPVPASPRTIGLGRCLSPLLIPAHARGAHHIVDTGCSSGGAPPASPLGAIQPDLYLRKDGPLFIGSSPKTGPSLGRLHFRLKYDFDRSDLIVHLIEAHDLAGSDQGGFNDPYVRLTLLPEVDTRKRQTTIRRNDPNPFFDQHFKFPISHEDLQSKTLALQVFDYDRFSRNDVIGEVIMTMDEFDVTSSIEVWGEITKNKKPPEELQEILVSLSYLPSAERLTVVLIKARNLFLPQEREHMDPYVKVHLLVNGKRIKKKKTAARKGSCNPVWNEALTFSLSASNIANAAIEICIMDQGNDLIGSNPLIGCCLLGPKESGPERDHWIQMTQSPRKAVARWHTMRFDNAREETVAIEEYQSFCKTPSHISRKCSEIEDFSR